MKIFILVLLFFSFKANAQEAQYELKGTLAKITKTDKKVDFTLKWSEIDGKAIGIYSDNAYTKSAPAKGISGGLGRIFVVTFPEEIRGVRTITLLGSDLKGGEGSLLVPISIVLRDDTGKPVRTAVIEANLTGKTDTRLAQKQEESRCQEGFGALAGYCGMYKGMVTEEVDTSNKCSLNTFTNIRLVLDENFEIGLALEELSAIVNPPIHRIGRNFTDPDSTRIDISSRSCRPLPGTSFKIDSCKRLNLAGQFSLARGVKHFKGNYSIVDEKTNEICRYHLSMDQTM